MLIEHQSSPDPLMVLRAARYQLEVIYHHVENSTMAKYPLVIPLVFYTGKRKWKYPLKLTSYFDDEKLATELLFAGLNLIRLQSISDSEIFKHQELSILEIVQKHILEKDAKKLGKLIGRALESGSKISDDLASYVLKYTLEEGQLEDPDEYIKFVSEQVPEYKEAIMNAGEKLVARGREQGMQQGMHAKAIEVANLLMAQGIDLTVIAHSTGLSLNQLKKSAQDISHLSLKSRKSSKH